MGIEPEATESRHETVTRRVWLRHMAALGAVAFLPGIAGCANDAAVFTTTTASRATLKGTSTTAVSSTSTQPEDPIGSVATGTSTGTSAATTTTTAAFPAGGEVVVRFTYSAGNRRVANPYIAVWFEDANGEWVETIALWFMQNREGLEYLRDLRRWYQVDGTRNTVDTISSATRRPGDYAVVWDGLAANGAAVPKGDYFVNIESAREDGPNSLIREPITIDGDNAMVALADSGELGNATLEIRFG